MAGNVFLYLYYILLGRIVGVTQYGIVTALLGAIMLFTAPVMVIAAVISKLASDLHAAGDERRLRRLADVVDRAAWSIAAVVFLAVALSSRAIGEFFHLSTQVAVLGAGAALAFSVVVTLQRAVLRGQHRFGPYALSYFVDMSSRAVLGVTGAVLFGVAGTLAGVSLDLLVTTVFNAVAMRTATIKESVALNLSLKNFGGSTTQIGIALLAINVMLFYDTILVRHFFSGETAGLYSAASLVGRAVYAVVGFVEIIILPNAAQRAARGERPMPLLVMGCGVIFGVGAVALAASAAAPSLLVRILAGPAFGAAGPYVLPYVAALVALAAANAVANYKIGLSRFEHAIPLAVVAIAQIVTVLLRHNSITDVLQTILIGDVCALAVTLYRVIPSPGRTQPLSARESLA